MKGAALAALLLVAAQAWRALAAEPVAVDVVNASRATRCAEEDNVYVKLSAPGITSLRISAEHPPYIASVRKDSTAPDFTACDMSGDPSFPSSPRKVTLYVDKDIRLVGHTFGSFWRPDVVDFEVGKRTVSGLHLVQLIKRSAQSEVEILVVYPADGYWRVKPLPPGTLKDTAYGSSFLFGPVDEDLRPFVAIRAIAFDPRTLTFRLAFRDGTKGVLKVAAATPAATRLAIDLDRPVGSDKPFAALRSMFVTTEQADVAIAVQPGAPAAPILDFRSFRTSSVRFGRVTPSRHNLTAPDLIFDEFRAAR